MKKYNILTKISFAVVGLSFLFASCSQDVMDKINTDSDHTHADAAKFILADVFTSTAFYNVGGDFNLYGSVYIEHNVGVFNQLYNAEIRSGEPTNASTFDNVWVNVYSTIKNTKIALAKCSSGNETGNKVTKGIAEVMLAYNSALLTDMFGDTPWSQAGETNPDGTIKYRQPKIDTQESIYAGVFSLLDSAIVDLQGNDVAKIGSYDFIYGGDASKWTKFAYGLKARYTMRLLKRSSDVTGDLNKIISYVDQSFASASEEADYAMYDGTKNINPLYDFQGVSRAYLGASQSLYDKLRARKDPRDDWYLSLNTWAHIDTLIPSNSDPKKAEAFILAPNGTPTQAQGYYVGSFCDIASTAPTSFLSYHELLFLKAEAELRLGKSATEVEPIVKQAVVAGLVNAENTLQSSLNTGLGTSDGVSLGITEAQAGSFFDTNIKPLYEANPLQETMIQKYIAFWNASGESAEAYSDYRRLIGMNANYIKLDNPLNSTKFPLRMPYGNSDVLNNPAIKTAYGDGQYVYTDPVWWAGGNH